MLYFRSPAVGNDLSASLDPQEAMLGHMAMPAFAASGLAASSVIDTARGPVLARDIRVGDRVLTRDNGLQPLRWVGSSSVSYGEPDAPQAEQEAIRRPVRIRAGAFGSNPDAGNLVLAPGHRVLLRSPLNELLFAADETMAEAGDLTHLDGVDMVPRAIGRWTHLLFDRHELIRANGLWVESFAPELWSLRVAFPAEWEAITEALPRLRYDSAEASYVEARITLDEREARLIDRI